MASCFPLSNFLEYIGLEASRIGNVTRLESRTTAAIIEKIRLWRLGWMYQCKVPARKEPKAAAYQFGRKETSSGGNIPSKPWDISIHPELAGELTVQLAAQGNR